MQGKAYSSRIKEHKGVWSCDNREKEKEKKKTSWDFGDLVCIVPVAELGVVSWFVWSGWEIDDSVGLADFASYEDGEVYKGKL